MIVDSNHLKLGNVDKVITGFTFLLVPHHLDGMFDQLGSKAVRKVVELLLHLHPKGDSHLRIERFVCYPSLELFNIILACYCLAGICIVQGFVNDAFGTK